jgi:hypothetical protein
MSIHIDIGVVKSGNEEISYERDGNLGRNNEVVMCGVNMMHFSSVYCND